MLFRQMYFVRGCEDGKFRIFRCHLELNKNNAVVHIYSCLNSYIQNNGAVRGEEIFVIYFNTTDNSRLNISHSFIEISGLVVVGEKCFEDGYMFYFDKVIPDCQNLQLGNL